MQLKYFGVSTAFCTCVDGFQSTYLKSLKFWYFKIKFLVASMKESFNYENRSLVDFLHCSPLIESMKKSAESTFYLPLFYTALMDIGNFWRCFWKKINAFASRECYWKYFITFYLISTISSKLWKKPMANMQKVLIKCFRTPISWN